MGQWKSTATVTWKFDSDQTKQDCMLMAKQQLESILNTNPHNYEGFSIQIDITSLKDRKRLIHLATFSLEDVLPYITVEDSKRNYQVGDKSYQVRMNSDRYHVFKASVVCVACGLTGTKMVLDMNPCDQTPHFNLYAVENGCLVLMTKDHIVAKSKGGTDDLDNFASCCHICNNLKANYELTYDQVRELRLLHNNQDRFTKKELRELINKRRDEMSRSNVI